jgi:phosphatidylglycerol lysyltransferase
MTAIVDPLPIAFIEHFKATAPSPAEIVATWGTSATSPFVISPSMTIANLRDSRAVAGYARRGGWAVTAGGVIGPPDVAEEALDEYLSYLGDRHLLPVFVAADDQGPYQKRGMHRIAVAEEPLINLDTFTLAGKAMASVRHSVAAARRGGLTVAAWSPSLGQGMAEVSAAWLATKRGGEMGFTLGAFDPRTMHNTNAQVAVDGDGRVVGFVTWHSYDRGQARVLDLMRRLPDAPNPTMDLLIASSLETFASTGVKQVSLAAVPFSQGPLAERVYPSMSLRRYKQKFGPQWATRWLVVPRRRDLPWALRAVARAYCPRGLRSAFRRNA